MFKSVLHISILLATLGSISTASAQGGLKALDQATAFARGEKVMKLEVEKKVVSDLLGKETLSPGVIHVRKSRFRWDVEKPEKSQMIFDGTTLWIAAYPPAGFDDPVQVTKTKISRKRDDQILLRLLTGDIVPSKSFELVSENKKDNSTEFFLKAKGAEDMMKDLKVVLEKGEFTQLSYKDDVDNLTVLRVLSKTSVKNPPKALFQFQVPKGAEVQEL